jgi:hypothetical protein
VRRHRRRFSGAGNHEYHEVSRKAVIGKKIIEGGAMAGKGGEDSKPKESGLAWEVTRKRNPVN